MRILLFIVGLRFAVDSDTVKSEPQACLSNQSPSARLEEFGASFNRSKTSIFSWRVLQARGAVTKLCFSEEQLLCCSFFRATTLPIFRPTAPVIGARRSNNAFPLLAQSTYWSIDRSTRCRSVIDLCGVRGCRRGYVVVWQYLVARLHGASPPPEIFGRHSGRAPVRPYSSPLESTHRPIDRSHRTGGAGPSHRVRFVVWSRRLLERAGGRAGSSVSATAPVLRSIQERWQSIRPPSFAWGGAVLSPLAPMDCGLLGGSVD